MAPTDAEPPCEVRSIAYTGLMLGQPLSFDQVYAYARNKDIVPAATKKSPPTSSAECRRVVAAVTDRLERDSYFNVRLLATQDAKDTNYRSITYYLCFDRFSQKPSALLDVVGEIAYRLYHEAAIAFDTVADPRYEAASVSPS